MFSHGGVTKLLKKLREAFIIRGDRILLREHHKSLNSQRRFEAQLKAAQQSAVQIDARCDVNLAGIDDNVKRIIKETVKSQSVKKEALAFDISALTNINATTPENTTRLKGVSFSEIFLNKKHS